MPIHQACRTHLTGYVHSTEYQDIFCGVKPTLAARDLGLLDPLIHVSEGANLVFLELFLVRLMRRWRWSEGLIVPVMVAFTAAHDFRPAAVRVTVAILLRSLIRHWQLRWPESQRQTAAGLASLGFCRSFAQLQGLMVAWIAGLSFLLARSKRRGFAERVRIQARLYFLLLPALLSYEFPHPVSIFSYALLYPFLGAALFTCALLVFICPSAARLTDPALDFLMTIFRQLSAFLPTAWPGQAMPLPLLALYLLALTAWCRSREAPPAVREALA